MVYKMNGHKDDNGLTNPLLKRRREGNKKQLRHRNQSSNSDSDNDPNDSSNDLHLQTHHALDSLHLDSIQNLSSKVYDNAGQVARYIMDAGWTVVSHAHLPSWLKDNDYLLFGHRPPLNSFNACFKSIFRIHTETGNIWTHLLGFLAFLCITIFFMLSEGVDFPWEERVVFYAFFGGAISCLGFSWVFHTVHCHSENVGKFFSKLDYCGIALLIIGSFVPWLYYSFYCRLCAQITYMILILTMGILSILISMMDKFAEPRFRPLRAGVFIALGLSAVFPVTHYIITDGFWDAIHFAALHWMVLMGFLYIAGAVIYACRIPERIWPGKFDIWFQSHQIFHVFVIVAAFIHYHAVWTIAKNRLTLADCSEVK